MLARVAESIWFPSWLDEGYHLDSVIEGRAEYVKSRQEEDGESDMKQKCLCTQHLWHYL
jgi:hypothetical protein